MTAKSVKWHRKLHNIGNRQRWRCAYCHGPIECVKCYPNTEMMATRDHVKPKCQGGGNTYDNLVLSCARCNNKKGDRSTDHLMTYLGLLARCA